MHPNAPIQPPTCCTTPPDKQRTGRVSPKRRTTGLLSTVMPAEDPYGATASEPALLVTPPPNIVADQGSDAYNSLARASSRPPSRRPAWPHRHHLIARAPPRPLQPALDAPVPQLAPALIPSSHTRMQPNSRRCSPCGLLYITVYYVPQPVTNAALLRQSLSRPHTGLHLRCCHLCPSNCSPRR